MGDMRCQIRGGNLRFLSMSEAIKMQPAQPAALLLQIDAVTIMARIGK